MRRIKSQDELQSLHAQGTGLVYSDYAGGRAGRALYDGLHVASGPWILKSSTAVPNYYADTEAEAVP